MDQPKHGELQQDAGYGGNGGQRNDLRGGELLDSGEEQRVNGDIKQQITGQTVKPGVQFDIAT